MCFFGGGEGVRGYIFFAGGGDGVEGGGQRLFIGTWNMREIQALITKGINGNPQRPQKD